MGFGIRREQTTVQQSDPDAPIDWEALLQNLTFVAFDTETTGLSANSGHLVEIAAVKFSLTGGVQEQFQSLINPGARSRGMPAASTASTTPTCAASLQPTSCSRASPSFR